MSNSCRNSVPRRAMRSAEVAACPRDCIPCVPRSATTAVGSIADDAAPAIGGLTTTDKMSAPAAIDERTRNLVEMVMVNSFMRTHQRPFPLESVGPRSARGETLILLGIAYMLYLQLFCIACIGVVWRLSLEGTNEPTAAYTGRAH